ncbi:MAG: Fe-S-cluster containining protein [Flavobacteriales bacterium]|jgi:Fe-S-cluster containining protein
MKDCNQCGKCCIHYSDGGLSASSEEIESWSLYRPDIMNYVYKGEIWVDPETKRPLTRCPWLELLPKTNANHTLDKYGCSIYHDRPDDCRQYPVTIADMRRDSCEMLEPKDLLRPKHAQKTLDSLMIDSRPPYLK